MLDIKNDKGQRAPAMIRKWITTVTGFSLVASATLAGTEVTFEPAQSFELAGSEPRSLVAAPFDADPFLDLICTTSATEGGNVTLLINDGSGDFGDNHDFQTALHSWGVAAADFNEDGNIDVAVTDGINDGTAVKIYLGDGVDSFSLITTLAAGKFPVGAVAGDFNGDEMLDLAVANNVLYGLTIFPGNGNGTFGTGAHVAGVANMNSTAIAMGHFNDDNSPDLAVSHYNGVRIFIGNTDGTFTVAGGAGSSFLTEAVTVADFNGDAVDDVASVEIYGGRLLVNLGRGDGTFDGFTAYESGSFCEDVTTADFNLDGMTDIVVANESNNNVAVFINDGCGYFLPRQTFAAGLQPTAVATGDFNADGFPDIAAAYRNLGDTPYVAVLLQAPFAPPVPGDANDDGAVTLSDFALFADCLGGPSALPTPAQLDCAQQCLTYFDFNKDQAVDTRDYAEMLLAW